ncbi:Phosphate transporter PHO1-like protein [Quillaja saponaria]|uniref:Phosphate transporter PHO1-like protein n=1 Tax=Quillaja saponaria TaxID=32244 RepID=A0AAD7KP59_QUISA|nr:Phosphate transporter PHO1-like protein [Quillaja saponaria]
MKFGKEFKKQRVPEWTEAYMDYNGLKRILREIRSKKLSKHHAMHMRALQHKLRLDRTFNGLHLQSNSPQKGDMDIEEKVIDVDALPRDGSRQFYKTNFLRQSEEGGEIEALFFQKLDEELNKVNTFYKDKAEALMHEANLLNKQMEALIALRVKVANPGQGQGREMTLTTAVATDGNNNQEETVGGSEFNPIQTTNEKEEELSFNKEELKKVEEKLRRAFIEFYHKLLLLKHYSFMNLSAFSKIMKKYEKITSRAAARAYIEAVDKSYLGSSDEVICLLERVESVFVKNFSHSNRRKGMKSLRPKKRKEKHSVTFFTGFFSGCLIALLVAIVLRMVSQDVMDKVEGTFYMEDIFPLYSLFGYIILHMLMYAANTYFWRRYRVNYPFIFGFKRGTELGYRDVFLLSTGLAVLVLASFLVNLHLEMDQTTRRYKTVTELVPLGLVILVLVILFCPFNIIYCSSRFFFIRCLVRCICAPLYLVTLPDFFLADQLTSQVQAFRSFELYICYYGLGEHSRRQQKCHGHSVYNTFYFIVAIIPFWLRLLQCIRRLCEDREFKHLFNGLKYFSTIVAIVIRTTFELKRGTTWMVCALISSAVAITINTYWDIVVDWGLLRRHSKNIYLRNKLVVPHRSVYFGAMVLNVVLRLVWMQWVLEFHWPSLHKTTITTIISCLEIVRRGIWSFFRLENEHLNNVGKYRTFKLVPLPFSYYNEEDNDKDN